MQKRIRKYSGIKNAEVSSREIKHREIARYAATQGFVLLKNDGLLPIKNETKVFLAGSGAVHAIKGGTGSGDVNEREVVNILTGLKNAGVTVINEEDILVSIADYEEALSEYVDKILNNMSNISSQDFFELFLREKKRDFKRISITKDKVESSDVAVYVISRVAGEGRDRVLEKGDYYLSDIESKELEELGKLTDKIVVLINAGSPIDVNEILKNKSVKAIMNISQPGMELGNAVADSLLGKEAPSGKLSDTWALEYKDYPNAATFSHNNGDTENERYTEGIYVGYRYFDSFNVKPAFPFGFGLSYTDFNISEYRVAVDNGKITVEAKITNTGDIFNGREVAQVYMACPQTGIKKEFKRLVGFKKTKLLKPNESEVVKIAISSKSLASYNEEESAWIVEKGEYGIFIGNSSVNNVLAGVIAVSEDYVIEKTGHIHPLQEKLEEIVRPDEVIEKLTTKWKEEARAKGIKALEFVPTEENKAPKGCEDLDSIAKELAVRLTDEEITGLLMGEISKGQDNIKDNELIETGICVPGAAGETTCALEEKYGIPGISMADGPAGLRVLRNYDVDRKSGKIYGVDLIGSLEGGLFRREYKNENVDTYYMYATAIPIGTHLAQTFDVDLVKELGKLVAAEMTEFGVAWWLAPGLNIHRNPLCGRNFEYYSEDPLLSGTMAAAITLGVQSLPGVGTTIKHFACNNQEDNRMGSNSIVSERALREIYLRGFEIAVKTAQPMCIMTSYNLINGIHTANSYDLCTTVARDEWGFEGIIMTDWTTTTAGGSKPFVCAIAGNDLIMPANRIDIDNIMAALKDGSLPRSTARTCAARLIKVIFQTIGMEDVKGYKEQFGF